MKKKMVHDLLMFALVIVWTVGGTTLELYAAPYLASPPIKFHAFLN